MAAKQRHGPGRSDASTAKASGKQARLAQALRANLVRRKTQARARAANGDPSAPPSRPSRLS